MQAGQILADSEKEVLELALKVAGKIIGRDLERSSRLHQSDSTDKQQHNGL